MTPAGRPCGTGRDQQAEQLQPGFLGQRPERGNRGFLIHRRVTLMFRVNPKYERTPRAVNGSFANCRNYPTR